ncbi:MAG: helix-turn-helix domain-containing protein [Oscillospiraceae bacterium]|nr:helix-turn-helix domain-containing protein [Oscillospiraceae bacterium]
MKNKSITGERMRSRRKEVGLSAEQVAKMLGVSPATVYRYENGEIEKVPGDLLMPLSEALSTTPAYLMGWSSNSMRNGVLAFDPNDARLVLIGNMWKAMSDSEKDELFELLRSGKVESEQTDIVSTLTENETEMLDLYRRLNARDQIKLIGQIEGLLMQDEYSAQDASKNA